ncbi:YaaW family protein [Pelistega ratti]|uniref:YaaW family protein n=1 Tax=Pelistega ratti TaxID=2652177 RepID=UPI002E27F733|nr:ubiquinol-cytochrome C chaperone family protein [Pelistega ratti]
MKYWQDIAAEIQTFGANTIATIFRLGKGVLYKEILCDACEDMKVNFNKSSSTKAIEKNLLDKVYTQAIEDLSEEQKKEVLQSLDLPTTNLSNQALTASLQAALLNVNFSPIVFMNFAPIFLQQTLLGRLLGIATGPIGWGLTTMWTVSDLAGPAKRVTIPAVIQIAMLRRKYS